LPLIDVLRVIIACALLFVSVQRGWLLNDGERDDERRLGKGGA